MEIGTERYRYIKYVANTCFRIHKTRNPFVIFRKLNVECSFIDLSGLAGCTNISERQDECSQKKYCVFINNKYSSYSKKIIAAHELGHLLLHEDIYLNLFDESYSSQIEDYEANIFAMEFMSQIQPSGENYKRFSPKELHRYICSRLCYESFEDNL